MDVSCPQCRTEYEFQDSRIPDEGLTVKCTQCGHVFRMKKPEPKVPTTTDEGEREWRLRQPGGNVFTFKRLTTLHRWIVERKVQKNDEISLTGESWKRLGDIAELASFFQVVDDARHADARSEPTPSAPEPPLHAAPLPKLAPPPPPQSLKPVDLAPLEAPRPRKSDTQPGFAFAPVTAEPAGPLPGSLAPPPPPVAAPPPPPARPAPSPQRRPPPAAYRPPDDDDDDEEEELTINGRGGGLKWAAVVLIVLGLGGAGGWYVLIEKPEQDRLAAEKREAETERLAKETREKETQAAKQKAEEEADRLKAAAEAEALKAKLDAGPPPAAVVVAPAGSDAGAETPKVAAPPKPRDFDQLMAEGERLREKDKPDAALALFAKAAELKPDRVEPMSSTGFVLLDQGKNEQAEVEFREALTVNARYGPALIGMAEASKALGKKEQAIAHYQKYLDVLPNGSEAPVARNAIERLSKP